MCGIAGLVHTDPDRPVAPETIDLMIDALAHRGPDDRGVWTDRGVGLGHCRLAILDTSCAGHQPMANSAGTAWITYNGECYNYPDLRPRLEGEGAVFRSRTDTEALVHLYDRRGIEMLAELEGMFAFGLWDASRRCLFLARDRLGIKPLYYRETAEGLAFASEMKALLALPGAPRAVDPAALWEYLHFMSIPGDGAFVAGIRKLPPGHCLLWEQGRTRTIRYWNLPDPSSAPSFRTEAETAEALRERLGRAVTQRLLADVPVGGFLSGGVDSSGIAALASAGRGSDFRTFGIAFPGREGFDETAFAVEAAAHCGVSHRPIRMEAEVADLLPEVVWHGDEPFAVASAVGVYLLAREARKEVKVVLSGDGADEVFAGYPWRHAPFSLDAAARWILGRLLRDGFVPGLVPSPPGASSSWNKLCRPFRYARSLVYLRGLACFEPWSLAGLAVPELYPLLRRAAVHASFHDHYLARAGQGDLAAKLYTDIKTTLVSEMLSKVDRMTMAAGLEARVPFLDHDFAAWAFGLPAPWKLREGEGKRILKQALAPLLPADLLHRKKHGFDVPLRHWMRETRFRAFLRDHLDEATVRRRGLFRPAAVTRLLEEHDEGRRDRAYPLYTLLCLELWLRRFLDGDAGEVRAVEVAA